MLERSLKKAASDLQHGTTLTAPQQVGQMLDLWKTLHINASEGRTKHQLFIQQMHAILSDGLIVRNRLAHGITGYGLADHAQSDAYVLTTLNGRDRRIKVQELQTITDNLGYLASHLGRITSFTTEPEKWKHSDLHSEIRDHLRKTPGKV